MDQKNHARRSAVIDAILGERAYQDAKFGPAEHRKNSLGDYLTIINQYWDEAGYHFSRGDHDQALHSIRKITALGFAAMEVHGAATREAEQGIDYGPADTAFDPFNEFLKGARVAADQPMSGDEPKAGPDIKFIGDAANVSDEMKDILRKVIGDLPPGVTTAHVLMGPHPSAFGFRR